MAYIDTEKLKRNIRVNLMPNVDIDGNVTVENAERYFLNLIDKTSTADVAEVRHGHWIEDGEYQICSVCGEEHHWDEYRATYCEDCGAKMDGTPKERGGNIG